MTVACARGRFGIALTVLVAVVALAPGAARAGTYEVVACDAAPTGSSSSWAGLDSPRMQARAACPAHGAPENGLFAGAQLNAGTASPFAFASQTFEAPAGTSIARLDARFTLHREDPYWQVGLFADGRMLTGCADAADRCLFPTAWPGTSRSWTFTQSVRRVYAQTACGGSNGCATGPAVGEPEPERAAIRVYSATVYVRDDSRPSLSDTGEGPLTDGKWHRGTTPVGYAASDNVGIRATRLYVDGDQRDDLQQTCDYSRRVPCPEVPHGSYPVDTQVLADGRHELRIEATDTAGNTERLVRSFNSDNTPPDAPADVVVDGGEGWRSVNGFRLSWHDTPSAAPIVAAHYELCPTAGGDCLDGERRGDGIDSIADLDVPGPGDYTARVWLEDAAGNVNGANRSVPVHLRFDDVAPGRAEPAPFERWTNADALDEPIAMGEGQVIPASGVVGYSITTDGSDPDSTIDVRGGSVHLTGLHDGATRVRARAVSGSGVPAELVGETTLHVDRRPPSATVTGAPDPAKWSAGPVTVTLHGSDQADLSGMAPSGPGEPVESGGYLEYRIDGGDPLRVRGDAAGVTIEADGDHTVVFHAVDAAGNHSPAGAARVRVDRTPPVGVVFEPRDAADPRTVAASASDATSGVARGVIQIRRAGSGGRWRSLRTTRKGARFVARIDDSGLTGTYRLRAVVTDRAGNVAIGDRRSDGSPALVDAASLRAATRLIAGIVAPHAASSSARVSAAKVRFGSPARVRGRLLRSSGAPVSGAVLNVWSRPALAGARYARVARVSTKADGRFSYKVPPGSSRTVRFNYAGSSMLRPSAGEVRLTVPAAVTIRASRRSVRNGQAVTFTGQLRGRPVPRGGKVLDLQAYYRGRWRTFATPRTTAAGRWRYRYRFGATRGRLVYRFRVKVRKEPSYPYALGYSRLTTVTVTG